VQIVGRAIRKAEDKSIGTVVVPVFIDESVTPEQALDASEFKRVWDVVKALRAHDEVLGEELDALRFAVGRRRVTAERPGKIVLDVPESVGDAFVRAFDVRLVEATTSGSEMWFGLLERFVAREGHARVKLAHVEDGYALGVWVNTQRRRYRPDNPTGRVQRVQFANERRKRLQAFPGWVWSLHDAKWEARFASLRRYVEREGHLRVPRAYLDEDGVDLGRWIREQRKAAVKHPERLSDGRRERLEATPGWSWKPSRTPRPPTDWSDYLSALVQYAEREGHTLVPFKHVENGHEIGNWAYLQRAYYNQRRRLLTPERIALLEAVPSWVWTEGRPPRHVRSWDDSFANLIRYVEREGRADVPRSHVEDGHNLGTLARSICPHARDSSCQLRASCAPVSTPKQRL
jgi:hypothetical protein